MKKQWLQLLDRIDALTLRERVFLFISVIACVLALADVLWLSPAQTAYKQLTQRFATQTSELDRLRGELRTSTRPVDPAKAVREDIAAATARLDAVNADIKALVPLDKNGPALEQVLVQLLRRHEGLVLQGLTTLKAEVSTTSLTKRGLELRVTGPYPELMRYVKTLETAMPALRWGALTLKSDKQPPELKLQVYVVGVQP